MKQIFKPFRILFSVAVLYAGTSMAQMSEKTVTVGGAAMFPSKNIIENAVNSKDHTTLVAAVKAAGLVETLQGDGPFTVLPCSWVCLQAEYLLIWCWISLSVQMILTFLHICSERDFLCVFHYR